MKNQPPPDTDTSKLSTSRTAQDADKYIIRFPPGMRDQIADSAKKNGRSMNAEIVQVLQDHYSQKPTVEHHMQKIADEQLDQLASEVMRRLLDRSLTDDGQRYKLINVTLPPAPPDKPKMKLPPRKPKT